MHITSWDICKGWGEEDIQWYESLDGEHDPETQDA